MENVFTQKKFATKIFNLKDTKQEAEFARESVIWKKLADLAYIQSLVGKRNNQEEIKGELVSEKLDTDLKKYINDLTFEDIVKVAWEVGNSIYSIHNNGYIHRDIKPANILLKTENDEIIYTRLIDFGISREYDTATSKYKYTIIGTKGYMAPEIMKKESYGIKIDIWSYGITLFEILFKKLPHCISSDKSMSNADRLANGIIDFAEIDKVFYKSVLPKLKFASKNDKELGKEEKKAKAECLYNYIKCCLKKNDDERPLMKELLRKDLFKNNVELVIRIQKTLYPYEKDKELQDLPTSSIVTFVGYDESVIYKDCEKTNIYDFNTDDVDDDKIEEDKDVFDKSCYRMIVEPIDSEKSASVLEKYRRSLNLWRKINESGKNNQNIACLRDCFILEGKGLVIVTDPFFATLANCDPSVIVILDIAKDIINGLKEIHSLNLVHREIVTENIYLFKEIDENTEKLRIIAKIGGCFYTKMEVNNTLTISGGAWHNRMIVDLEGKTSTKTMKNFDLLSYGVILLYMILKKEYNVREDAKNNDEIEEKIGQAVSDSNIIDNIKVDSSELLKIAKDCIKNYPEGDLTAKDISKRLKNVE